MKKFKNKTEVNEAIERDVLGRTQHPELPSNWEDADKGRASFFMQLRNFVDDIDTQDRLINELHAAGRFQITLSEKGPINAPIKEWHCDVYDKYGKKLLASTIQKNRGFALAEALLKAVEVENVNE